MSPCCVHAMGVFRALALFGDAKQAMGEGKRGPVETELTGLVATVLHMYSLHVLTLLSIHILKVIVTLQLHMHI